MPVDVKEGALGTGSWRRIANGSIRAKKPPWELDAGTWFVPTKCYVKIGEYGGGYWRDTGYESYPSVPSNMWVQQWNYSQTLTGFSGPSGGPPIDYYHVERYDQNGTAVEGYYDTSGSRWWNTPQDTRHQFRVRSHGVNGLWSAWSPYLRVGIGHASTPNYGWVERTRDWSNGGYISARALYLEGFSVPNRTICNRIHWQLWTNFGTSVISVWPPQVVEGGNRQIEIHLNEDYVWDHPYWPNPLDGWDGAGYPGNLQFWGNGGRTGIKLVGPSGTDAGGWTSGLGVDGYINLYGVQYYDNYEIVSWNPEQGNYYW
jgi:hypothetical protein